MLASNQIQMETFNDLKEDVDKLKKIESNIVSWFDYFKENIEESHSDVLFALGNQWESYEIAEFELRQKVYLVSNVLWSQITQIIAEDRQNTPQTEVRNLDDSATQQEINLFDGILKNIAYNSNSNIAYQTAFLWSLTGGFGAWRICIDYEGLKSFNKIAKILPIKDPTMTYFDPNANEPTKSDGEFCGVYTRMALDEFRAKFPDVDISEMVSMNPPTTNSGNFIWYTPNEITVCEHFQKIYESTTLYLLNNGETILEKDLEERLKELRKEQKEKEQITNQLHLNQRGIVASKELLDHIAPKIKIVSTRETETCKIKHYKLIKDKILEESEYPGDRLPIIFVDGDSIFINGKQRTKSFIKNAKDMQRFLNFCISEIAQSLKTAHKGKFMASTQQVGDFMELWKNPENPSSVLLFDPQPGSGATAPTYIPPTEVSHSLLAQPASILNLIQNILGRYEASRGAQGNEQSGIAVKNRAKQGNLAVYVYLDNLYKAKEETARHIVNILPDILSNNTHVAMKNKEDKIELIKLNEQNKLKKLSFDVSVTIGSSFEMQKSEAYAQLMQLIGMNPQALAPLLSDLVAENTNLENTQKIVERIRDFVVPPEVIAKEQGKKLQPKQPNPQLVIAQQESQARLMEAQAKIAKVQQDSQVSNVKAQAEIGKAQLEYHGKLAQSVGDTRHLATERENEKLRAELDKHKSYLSYLHQMLPKY